MKQHTFAPWLIIMAGVVAAMHIGKLPPTIPILQQQLNLNLNQVGFLLSAIQAAGMLCALSLGMVAGKIGLKKMLMGGLGTLMVASALGACSQHFYALFTARLLEGLGFLCVILPAPALLRQLVSLDKLKSMMAYWGAYMGLGVALSLLITPLGLQAFHWSSVWLGFAGLALLMALWVWRVIPVLHVPDCQQESLWQLFRQILSHAPSWLLGWVFACYTSQWFAIMGFLPSIYMQANVAAAHAGMLTALVCLSNVLGSVLSGILLQQGRRAISLLSTGFVVMIVGTIMMFAGVHDLPFAWQYVGVLAFSMVGGLIPGVVFAYAGVLAPSPQLVAGSIGWIQQWSSLGQFCLPPLMGVLVTWWGGWEQAWTVCVTLSILGILGSFKIQSLIDKVKF